MKPKKTLLAIITDTPLTIDDCFHRITYRVYRTESGFEIACRNSCTYCYPFAPQEARVPRITKQTAHCSDTLAPVFEEFFRTPLLPASGGNPTGISDFTLKVGDYGAQTTYKWNAGGPPESWEILNRLAHAIIEEFDLNVEE